MGLTYGTNQQFKLRPGHVSLGETGGDEVDKKGVQQRRPNSLIFPHNS
jgi:hypothetical protein